MLHDDPSSLSIWVKRGPKSKSRQASSGAHEQKQKELIAKPFTAIRARQALTDSLEMKNVQYQSIYP